VALSAEVAVLRIHSLGVSSLVALMAASRRRAGPTTVPRIDHRSMVPDESIGNIGEECSDRRLMQRRSEFETGHHQIL
jgi:hypothetical protein